MASGDDAPEQPVEPATVAAEMARATARLRRQAWKIVHPPHQDDTPVDEPLADEPPPASD